MTPQQPRQPAPGPREGNARAVTLNTMTTNKANADDVRSIPCSAPLAVAELNHLWWGVCIGGRHYTGDIRHGRPRTKVEMIRKLSAREAKEHAEREGRMWLARERETNKFDTLKQLERHAARWCADNLGEQWVLLYDEGNPSIVIAGKGWIVTRIKTMNKLAKAWDKVPNSQRDFNHPSIKQLYRAWNTLLQEPNDQALRKIALAQGAGMR